MSKAKFTNEQFIADRKAGLTLRQIAEKYGVALRNVERRSSILARKGEIAPKGAPGFSVVRNSQLLDANGNLKMEWVITNKDTAQLESMMNGMMEAFCEELPREKPKYDMPAAANTDLLNMYVLTDVHVGMLAHKHESGENYSTAIAEETIDSYMDYALSNSPNADTGLLVLLGDLMHFDGLDPVTPTSGHVLDADSRFAKVVYVVIRSIRRAIASMLVKHRDVKVVVSIGNHDLSSMIWLRAALAAVYENEPRVSVDVSPTIIHRVHWGKTLLGFTHGHSIKKPDQRLMTMATDYREEFGKSKFVYCHSGHLHNYKVTENNLGIDIIHPTLAAKDSYATQGGWRSMRSAACITYSKEFGEVSTLIFRPEMIS